MDRSTEFEGVSFESLLENKHRVILPKGSKRFWMGIGSFALFLMSACTSFAVDSERTFTTLTVDSKRNGIFLQALCNPDNSITLQVRIDGDKLRSAAPDRWKKTEDSWMVIANMDSGKKVIVEAVEGRIRGRSLLFVGKAVNIRSGGELPADLKLESGQGYEVSFYNDPITDFQPVLKDSLANIRFNLDCQESR